MAELIVETCYPGMVKAPAGTRGHDFIDDAGLRVQVKGWGTDTRTHDKIDMELADRLIQLRIYDDGWEVIADVLLAPMRGSGMRIFGRNTLARFEGGDVDPRSLAAFKANATRGLEDRRT